MSFGSAVTSPVFQFFIFPNAWTQFWQTNKSHPDLLLILELPQCRDDGVDGVNRLVRTWPEHQHHGASASRPLKRSLRHQHTHSAKGTTRDVFRHDSTLLGNMSDSCRQIYSFTINVPAVKKKKKTQLTDQDRRWRITAADTFDLARQHEGVISCKYCTVKPLRDGFMEAISFRKDTFTSVVFALSVD